MRAYLNMLQCHPNCRDFSRNDTRWFRHLMLCLINSVVHSKSSYIIYHRPICIKNVFHGIVTCNCCEFSRGDPWIHALINRCKRIRYSFLNIRDRYKCCKVKLCISYWWLVSELSHQCKSLHTSFWAIDLMKCNLCKHRLCQNQIRSQDIWTPWFEANFSHLSTVSRPVYDVFKRTP
jgi:hypothetical protein